MDLVDRIAERTGNTPPSQMERRVHEIEERLRGIELDLRVASRDLDDAVTTAY